MGLSITKTAKVASGILGEGTAAGILGKQPTKINVLQLAAIQAKAKEDNRTFTNMVTTILEDWRKKETKAA